MANNDNPGDMELKLLKLQRGIAQVLVGGKTIPFQGKTADATTLGPLIANALGFFEDVHAKKSAFSESVATRVSQEPGVKKLIQDIRNGAVAQFGETSSDFQDLGFSPRKKNSELTPEQKQLKTERLRATRQARKSVGSRQRLAIKGVVNPTPPVAGDSQNGNGAAK